MLTMPTWSSRSAATAHCCSAARILNYREIPILGLSYGHLGFLTAASPEERDILQVVSDALSGELHVSRRATIAAGYRLGAR